MKRIHLVYGAFMLVVFLLTGKYMDRVLHHLEGMPDGPRLLYRTRHIFILLAALLNLGLGAYLRMRPELGRKTLQVLGSALIVAATALFAIAFFYEPTLKNLETPLSHWGAYSIATGTLLHAMAGSGGDIGESRAEDGRGAS